MATTNLRFHQSLQVCAAHVAQFGQHVGCRDERRSGHHDVADGARTHPCDARLTRRITRFGYA
jgi:hypothetical protein